MQRVLDEELQKKLYNKYKSEAKKSIAQGQKSDTEIKSAVKESVKAETKNPTIYDKQKEMQAKSHYLSSTPAQRRTQQISESVAAKTNPTILSAKAISSEAETKPIDYTPAAQRRKQATGQQIYGNVLKGEAYLRDTSAANNGQAENLVKGLVNRLRSAGGVTGENLAYVISDNVSPDSYFGKTSKKVINNNYAGQISDIADQQLMAAKENTGDFGDFLIDTADAGANMASQALLSAMVVPVPISGKFAVTQGLSTGAQKYKDTRESGGSKAEAWQRGVSSGTIAYATESIAGIGKAGISKIPGINKVVTHLDEFGTKNWLTHVLLVGAEEGGEEGLEYAFEFASDLIADLMYKGEVETEFNVAELFRNVASGFLMGAGFGAVVPNAKTNAGINSEAEQTTEASVTPDVKVAETDTPTVGNEQEGVFANGREEATRPLTEQEVHEIKKGASILTDTDGNTYIDIKSDILANVAPQNWATKVKNVIRSVFPKGFYINGEHIDVSAKSRGEFTNSKDTNYLKRSNPETYADKMKTAPYLDVISQNAQYNNESPTHERIDDFESFDKGSVSLRIGGKDYNANVVIGVKKDGSKTFYDITGMGADEKTAPVIGSQSAQTENTKAKEPSDNISSNNKIPQDDSIVKNETTKPQTVEEAIAQPNEETKNPITEQEVEEAAEILGESEEKILEEKVPQKEITEWEKQKIKDYLKGGFPQGANKNLDAIENGDFSIGNIRFKGNAPGFNDLQRAVMIKQLIAQQGNSVIDIEIPNDGKLQINNTPHAVASVLDKLKVSIDANQDAEISKTAENIFKKSSKIAHFKSNGKDYLTNGFFAVKTNTSGKDKIADAYPRAYTESDKDMFEMLKNTKTEEVSRPPKEVTKNKEKSYVFETENGDFVFNKQYVDAIDSGKMYIGSYGSVGAFIKTVDGNGDIIGLVLSLNKASALVKDIVETAKTNSVPAKLKSLSGRKSPAKKKDSYDWSEADEYIAKNNNKLVEDKKDVAIPSLLSVKQEIDNGRKYTIDEINSFPEVAEAKKRANLDSKEDSINKFYDFEANDWSLERKEKRNEIIEKLSNLGSAVIDGGGEVSYNGIVEQGRHADIVIGPPAAGKSTVFADPLSQKHKARIIDSDMVKELLPEFDNGYGANFVHNESSRLAAHELTDLALSKGENVVFPLVGKKTSKIRNLVQKLKDNGYTVNLYYNEVAPETSLNRAFSRFISNGRFVPFDYVANVYKNPNENPSVTYYTLLKEGVADYYEHRSNDVRRGMEAYLVEDRTGRDLYRPGNRGTFRHERPLREHGYSDSGSLSTGTQSTRSGEVNTQGDGGFGKNTVGAAESNPKSYAHLQNEHGVHDLGEEPRARDANVPLKDEHGNKTSEAVRTIMEAKVTTDELIPAFEKEVAAGTFEKKGTSNDKAVEEAAQRIVNKPLKESVNEFRKLYSDDKVLSKDDAVFGQLLYSIAAQKGDTETAIELASMLSSNISRTGDALQAQRILKRLSPEGRLYHAQRITEKFNKDSKQKKKIELDEDTVKKVLDAKTDEEIQEANDAVAEDIAKQIDKGFWNDLGRMWNAWRYFSMLGNPKTHIRNIFGNFAFLPERKLKNVVKAGIEGIAYKTGWIDEKTASIKLATKENKEFAKESFKKNKKALLNGGNYRFESEIDQKREQFIFSGNQNPVKKFFNAVFTPVRAVAKGNNELLEAEDVFFLKNAYIDSLTQYLTANNLDGNNLTDGQKTAAENYAAAEAQKATYRDASAIANALEKLSKSEVNIKGVKVKLRPFVDAVVPFRKTPINVLARAVEYSPVGLATTLALDGIALKQKKITANEMIDHISSGLTGSGIYALGIALAIKGVLTGGEDEDKKAQDFAELQGEQTYAIKIGDGSYTLDWLSPTAIPLFLGAETVRVLKKEYDGDEKWYEVAWGILKNLDKIANPMLEMSMLQNLDSFLGSNYGSDGSAISGLAQDLLASYVLQAVPTLLSQVAQTTDGTRRNAYYVDKTDKIPDSWQIPLQRAMAKIPGLSQKLPAYVDEWGRTQTQTDNMGRRIVENFFSPGYYKENKTTKVDEMLEQLYAKTGDHNVLPSNLQKYVNIDGENVPLSSKDYVTAQKKAGQTKYNMLSQLIADKDFQKLSAENKAEVIGYVYEYGNVEGKQAVSDYEPTKTWYKKMEDAHKQGVSVPDYLIAKNYYSGLESKDGRTVNLQMYDYLIADKGTSAKQDVILLEKVANVDMTKYKNATSKDEEILDLYSVIADDANKENDIESLVAKGYSNSEALAKYNVATGDKKYKDGEFKFGNAPKQVKKAEKLAEKGYDPETIAKAANAVTSFGKFGTKENYKTYVKMLNSVGITDEKFIKAFWNIYVNG